MVQNRRSSTRTHRLLHSDQVINICMLLSGNPVSAVLPTAIRNFCLPLFFSLKKKKKNERVFHVQSWRRTTVQLLPFYYNYYIFTTTVSIFGEYYVDACSLQLHTAVECFIILRIDLFSSPPPNVSFLCFSSLWAKPRCTIDNFSVALAWKQRSMTFSYLVPTRGVQSKNNGFEGIVVSMDYSILIDYVIRHSKWILVMYFHPEKLKLICHSTFSLNHSLNIYYSISESIVPRVFKMRNNLRFVHSVWYEKYTVLQQKQPTSH